MHNKTNFRCAKKRQSYGKLRQRVFNKTREKKMSELLESVMLICFGLSWPISLAKNIKARSARNMSLRFTLLIILGYAAGITGKILNGVFNYVLIVYLVNLIIVSANLVVYFINRRYDRKEIIKNLHKVHVWSKKKAI